MSLDFEMVLEYLSLKPSLVWELLVDTHREFLSSFNKFNLFGKKTSLSKMKSIIEHSGDPYFYVEFNNSAIHYGPLGNHKLSFILIEGCVMDIGDAEKWILPIIGSGFLNHARIYDKNYHYWQNASDPLQYTSEGKSLNGLTLQKQQFLNYTVIDTSNNPGRREIRKGFIEALGHVMWFSDKFWKITGKNLDDLRNNVPCEIVMVNDRVHRVKFQDKPFTESEGPEADLQNRIRNLLFPAVDDA